MDEDALLRQIAKQQYAFSRLISLLIERGVLTQTEADAWRSDPGFVEFYADFVRRVYGEG